MEHPVNLLSLYVVVLLFALLPVISTMAKTQVEVRTPLTNVKEGDMLSVICQVWNAADDHKIMISRKTDESSGMEQITWDQDVQSGVDDRVFLATRRLEDGSYIYFMSIIDIVKEDSGLYYCKVIQMEPKLEEIDAAWIPVDVNYFPTSNYPTCSPPSGTILLTIGTSFLVNCSSEIGYPSVDLQWFKSRKEPLSNTRTYNVSGLVVSELLIRGSPKFQGAVLACELRSPAFPGRAEVCHVGPIQVVTSNGKPLPPLTPEIRTPSEDVAIQPTSPRSLVPIYTTDPDQCSEVCPSTLASPVMYWILATVFIGLIALIFMLITLMLAAKVCRSPSERNRQYIRNTHKRAVEELYEKLECRRDDQTVYMSLQRPRKPDNLVVLRDSDLEGNYTGTPTVPTM